MKRKLVTCVLALAATGLCFSGPFASAGEVYYRWKDSNGNPFNSVRPPPQGVEYEVISTRSSMVRPVESDIGAVPKTVEPTASNSFEPVDSSRPQVEKNPEYCARAKENLNQLDSHARIRLRNEQGEVRFLSEEEKQAERRKALDAIETYCE